jgi:hypothetical protein
MKTEISIDDLIILVRKAATRKWGMPSVCIHTPRKGQLSALTSALREKGVKKDSWINYKDDSTIWEEFGQDTAVFFTAYEYTNVNYLTFTRLKNDSDEKNTPPNLFMLYEFDDISDYKIKGGQNGTD